LSPPKRISPDANNARANPNTNNHHEVGYQQDSRFDDLAARGRRRGAAVRSTVISTCSCIRDPEVDRHRCGGGITDKLAEAAVMAAEHLASVGLPGMFDVDTCRSMWRMGQHRLAAECFSYASGEAA
jgi:hypothetical protein